MPTSALSRQVRGEVNKDLRSRTSGLKAGHGSSHIRPGTGESIGTWATELQTFRLPAIAGKCMAGRGPNHQNGHLKHTCAGATANTAQPPSGAKTTRQSIYFAVNHTEASFCLRQATRPSWQPCILSPSVSKATCSTPGASCP